MTSLMSTPPVLLQFPCFSLVPLPPKFVFAIHGSYKHESTQGSFPAGTIKSSQARNGHGHGGCDEQVEMASSGSPGPDLSKLLPGHWIKRGHRTFFLEAVLRFRGVH